jgi:HK97 family phage major capsid protein
MNTKSPFRTFGQVQKDLQAIADQVGSKHFERSKALYLEGVVVTDETGNPLPPESLSYEVRIMPAVEQDAQGGMPQGEEPAKQAETAEKSMRTVIRETIATELKAWSGSQQPQVSVLDSGFKVTGRVKHLKSAETAYKMGRFFAACMKHQPSIEWAARNGYIGKGHTEGINSAGGFLVPEEFESELVSLRETYGVFRKYARTRTMTSDTLRIPRRKSTLTAYAVGEAAPGTESQQVFDQINLVAKKFMVLSTISNELNEDAFVNLGDDTASEIAYAFAKREDECGFIGDGTGTLYHGIIGLLKAFTDISGTIANIKGLHDATGNAWSGVLISDLSELMAKLPAYADTANTRWYCSKAFYHSVMEKLAYDAGGVTARELKDGVGQPTFMGYPVVFSQVLDRTSTQSSIPLYFGDLSLSSYFGDRRGMSMKFSDSALNAFEQDEIAVAGTSRFDIVNANVGDTTEAGPIVGLYIST